MIELKVLAVESEGRATEYKISPSPVMLGGKDSYGVETLHLTVPEKWEGCALRVTFTPELCEGITRPVVGDNVVEIDAAITAAPVGKLTVEATNDENQRYFTHSVPYVVYDHEAVGKDIPAPGSDLWQQFVDDTLANANAAKAARDAAQTAEANALQDREEARAAAEASAFCAAAADESAREAEGFAGRAEEAAESLIPFYAEYGATSYDAIAAVHQSGRCVYAVQKTEDGNEFVGTLMSVTPSRATFYSSLPDGRFLCWQVWKGSGTWDSGYAPYAASEELEETKPFYAEYEITKYADVLAAYKSGRAVFCRYYSYVAPLNVVNEGAGTIWFYMHNGNTLHNYVLTKEDKWLRNEYYHSAFYATFGETSFADIEAAYRAGREVRVIYNVTCIGCMMLINLDEETRDHNYAMFELVDSNGTIRNVKISRSNEWTHSPMPYVKNSDYASETAAGVAKTTYRYGIITDGNGFLSIYPATTAHIDGKSVKNPITPNNLDYAVKKGLCDSKLAETEYAWTDEEKAAARELLGAVGATDYASNSVHGVVRYDAYYGITGGTAGSAGVPIPVWASNEEINAKNERRFINAKNLDYALKKSLTTNTETLTTEEKTKAQEWLGIKKATNEAKPYTLVERTANGVIYVGTPTEAKHAATKEYVDGLAVDRSKGVVTFEDDGTQVAIPWAYNTAGNSFARRLGNGTLWVETPDVDKAAANKAYVDGKVCGHYTILRREGKMLDVICHGLVNGETYTVQLFTATRRRGNAFGGWRHPSNENTGEGFTGKGYARLAIQRYAGAKKMDTTAAIYPGIPEWMPRYGILQTEWSFTAAADTHTLTIDLAEFILPMLKPEADNFEAFTSGAKCQMIGVARGTMAPLLMQFRVERGSTGAIGESKNTLRIGEKIRTDADGELPLSVSPDKETGKYRANGLYISVV